MPLLTLPTTCRLWTSINGRHLPCSLMGRGTAISTCSSLELEPCLEGEDWFPVVTKHVTLHSLLWQIAEPAYRVIHDLQKKKSICELIKEIEEVLGKVKSYGSIHRYFLRSLGAKPFHQVPSPLISTTNVDDRLWFVNHLSQWNIEDFMHLAPSDELFIYERSRPNHQNDRKWAINIDDIPKNVKVRQTSKYPACIGIFSIFLVPRREVH